jgi:colanic acid/amylovoran biosynthesis glycosyltransferase
MNDSSKKLRIAFVVGVFPVVSETFIINQIADLIDRGVDITIYTFKEGDIANVSDRYFSYHMKERTKVLQMPKGFFARFGKVVPKMLRLLVKKPTALLRALNFAKYGRNALSGKTVFWVEPFLDAKCDLVHCHFGPIANKFLVIRDILKLSERIVVTFYGADVSQSVKEKGIHYYDRLKEEADLFFTMSENMKSRVVLLGFDPTKVVSLPVSIDVPSYPFANRAPATDGVFHMLSVGRFVEKKGFDDLLRMLAILKKKTTQKFLCHIVGGPKDEEEKLRALAVKLEVDDVVELKGYMKVEDIIQYFLTMQLYVQTSKTAQNGDME